MYFNRKNSQQKNWRMIKKGKHFLFGCALVFTLGATANVASAETIVSEVTTVDQAQDSTAASEDADSEAAASTTAVSEVASSTTTTSEAASETVSTSTVASSEASETTSTASEVAVSESSEASETSTASETATSTTAEAVSEVSTTVSASETANVARTAYIGYEVQYTTSSGEVVGKTANIVAADTTKAVATSILTVAATDVPAGYELATEQAYSLTQQISENQVNILSFAVVKKSEEEEIAASQLENKTPLLQAIAEAEALTSEATRLLATSQKENSSLAVAADATKAVTAEARTVLKDATASEEQVQATTATVQASSVSLGEELAKLNADGIVTAQLSSVTGLSNVVDQYNITWDSPRVAGRDRDAGFELRTDANGKRILVYKYNLADSTAFTIDDVLKQLNATPKDANAGLRTLDGTEKSKIQGSTEGYGTAGNYAQKNGQPIDFLDIVNPVKLWGGQQVVGPASPAHFDSNYTTLYVPGTTVLGTKSHQTTVGGTNGTSAVTVDGTNTFDFYANQVNRQKLYIRSSDASYEANSGSAVATDTDTDTIPVYLVGYNDTTRPTVTANTTTGSQLNASNPLSEYLFVFGTTEGTTSISTVIDPVTKKAPTGTPVVNKDNATATFATMTDPENDALTISYDDNAASPKTMTSLGSNLTLGTDGKLEGSFAHAAGGSYTRRVVVTDPSGDKGTSNAFYTYSYTDKEVDTTPVLKRDGVAVTEAEVFAKLAIANTSTTFPVNGTGQTAPTIPDSEYTRTIVGYLPLGSETVTEATASTLPTSGQYEVVVRTRNIYGQDIYNWVTVQYQPATLYVFNNTAIKTVDPATKQPNGVDKVSIATLTDPEGIKSVAITREGATLGYTVDTDGNASGTPSVGALGYYSSSLTITDNQDNTTEVFRSDGVDNRYVTHIMDATVADEVTKGVGETPTEAEI
ncbi:TPA: KxYKxGKxW signal peptide domain-containing protein, partial [Streptococcus suis]